MPKVMSPLSTITVPCCSAQSTLTGRMNRLVPLCALLVLACTSFAVPQQKVDRVLILKSEHKLLLLNGTTVVRTYAVAVGRGGLEPKRQQGDHKTPEGLYRVDHRNSNSRFYRALHLSYPNEADLERAKQLGVSPGGDIMVHGIKNGLGWIGGLHRLIDWTDGCIAVTDAEIDEIWSLVADGTPVEIRH
jgi:murein L,D-transpeptidase YafK